MDWSGGTFALGQWACHLLEVSLTFADGLTVGAELSETDSPQVHMRLLAHIVPLLPAALSRAVSVGAHEAGRERPRPEQGCLSQGGSTGFPGLWVRSFGSPVTLLLLGTAHKSPPTPQLPALFCSHRVRRSYVAEPRVPGWAAGREQANSVGSQVRLHQEGGI